MYHWDYSFKHHNWNFSNLFMILNDEQHLKLYYLSESFWKVVLKLFGSIIHWHLCLCFLRGVIINWNFLCQMISRSRHCDTRMSFSLIVYIQKKPYFGYYALLRPHRYNDHIKISTDRFDLHIWQIRRIFQQPTACLHLLQKFMI